MNIHERIELAEALGLRWEYEGPREVCGLPGVVTVPPTNQGDQFPAIIYNIPLAGQITTTNTSLLTVPATGTYRITICASQTVLGVGSPGATTFTPTVVWTDPSASGTSSTALAVYSTGATNGTLGYLAGATNPYTLVMRCKSGTAIQLNTVVTGGGGTTNPTVVITPIIETLGT